MSAYIGIDPGISGAIAYVSDGSPAGFPCYDAHEFAKHEPPEWVEWLKWVRNTFGVTYCVIERVWAPIKLVKQAGMCELAASLASLQVELVTPREWQARLGCLTGGDKNVTKQKAQELFPGPLKITHGNADALLIAEYCRRTRAK